MGLVFQAVRVPGLSGAAPSTQARAWILFIEYGLGSFAAMSSLTSEPISRSGRRAGWAMAIAWTTASLSLPLPGKWSYPVFGFCSYCGCTACKFCGVWQYALWGLVGAAANRAVLFLEASQRVKGWPWTRPKGPGGGVYAVSVIIHLGIAAATGAALATTAIITNGFIAFGIGAAAPIVVKKVAGYVETLIPAGDDEQRDERGEIDAP